MGKPISEIKPDDTVVIGITNRIGNDRLLFLETDYKDKRRLNQLLKYLDMRLIPELHTYIVIGTRKGFHVVYFNRFLKSFAESTLFYARDMLDRYHVGYSIAKGFSTLRISRRWKVDGFKFVKTNIGTLPVSKPHWELYKVIVDFDAQPIMFFDEGIEIVGYVIDEQSYKKKAKVGMIIGKEEIRTWQTKVD